MPAAIHVMITDTAVLTAALLADFEAQTSDQDGAVGSFFGRCRSEGGTLSALELEYYPGMAERAIADICNAAAARWPITRLHVTHRHGLVKPGETIVAVLAASAHRNAALDAVSFVMDFLKTDAPFWKREHKADGSFGDWVDAKASDEQRLQSWTNR